MKNSKASKKQFVFKVAALFLFLWTAVSGGSIVSAQDCNGNGILDTDETATFTFESVLSPPAYICWNVSPITRTINVAQEGLINDVNIHVDVHEEDIGDIRIEVTAPDGTTVVLHSMSADTSENISTTYDDEAVPNTTNPSSPLSAFDNRSMSGDWSIRVFTDFNCNGRLNYWGLDIEVSASDCNFNGILDVCESDTDSDGTIDECDDDIDGDGISNACDNDFTGGADCNGNGMEDSCENFETVTYVSSPGLPVGYPATTSDVITVDSDSIIQDIDVLVDISHTFIGDLGVSVSDPTGTEVLLHNQAGGDTNDINVIYDDDGEGVFPLGFLTFFDGSPANGDWEISVEDYISGDDGVLNTWGLVFVFESGDCNGNGVPDSCESDTDSDGDGMPDYCDSDIDGDGIPNICDIDFSGGPDCNQNGVVDQCDINRGTSDDCNGNLNPDECDVEVATSEDCNLNGIPDECDVTGATTYVSSPGLPVPPTGSDIIAVDSTSIIQDVDVMVDISHTFIGDLAVSVASPGGSVVLLHNGTGGSIDDINVTYDDDGSGTLPFGNLSAFDGFPAIGDWEIMIEDAYPISDDGVLNTWGLIFETDGEDCNGNGIVDICENEPDTDGDGTIDECDADIDGDGIPNACDIDQTGGSDCDADGQDDSCQEDTDSDGNIDVCDDDIDGDGVLNSCDVDQTGGSDLNGDGVDDDCQQTLFKRGDSNADGGFDIGDAISTLGYLFGGESISCIDAADANDDGQVDIADAINKLGVLFSGSTPLPTPGSSECGADPTDDNLECELYNAC